MSDRKSLYSPLSITTFDHLSTQTDQHFLIVCNHYSSNNLSQFLWNKCRTCQFHPPVNIFGRFVYLVIWKFVWLMKIVLIVLLSIVIKMITYFLKDYLTKVVSVTLFGTKVWNWHILFSFIILIQNT
jgi:hypothetical protein